MAFVIFVALSIAVTAVIFCAQRRARTLASDDWETLVSRLQPVSFNSLETVALDHLQPNGHQVTLETSDIWTLMGGMEGLAKMENNAEVMVRLAAYVRVWNFEEAMIVSERIRYDAVLLKRALLRIRFQMVFSKYRLHVPFHMQQAASSYYLMTRRLLALYETNQYVLYPRLAEAF